MGGGVQTADDDVAAAPDTEELVRTVCRRRPTECFAPKAAMIPEIKQSFRFAASKRADPGVDRALSNLLFLRL